MTILGCEQRFMAGAVLRLLLILIFWMIWAIALAASGDLHYKKSQHLIELLKYKAAIAEVKASCIRSLEPLHPAGTFARDSNAFPGIKQGGQAWLELVEAFAVFQQQACGGSDFERQLLEQYRAAWQARLTERQMDAAMGFLQTGDGLAFAEALHGAYREVSAYYMSHSASMRENAFRNFERRAAQIGGGRLRFAERSKIPSFAARTPLPRCVRSGALSYRRPLGSLVVGFDSSAAYLSQRRAPARRTRGRLRLRFPRLDLAGLATQR